MVNQKKKKFLFILLAQEATAHPLKFKLKWGRCHTL